MGDVRIKEVFVVSGHRIRRSPVHKAKAWKWGPPGWYCCGTRLMAAATLSSGAQVHRCLHCGLVIGVAEEEIKEVQRPDRQIDHVASAAEQLTWRL